MDDLISRQDAIKAIEEKAKRIKNEDTLNGLAGAVGILFDLPSVNPQPCGDAISRQAVDEIKELMTDINGDTVYAVRMSDIRQLPPVKPQEKTGRWIQENSVLRCSICDVGVARYDKYSYCPNCGAKMIEKQKRSNKCKNCEYYRNPDYTKCHECEAERNNK